MTINHKHLLRNSKFIIADWETVLLSGVQQVVHRHPPAWLEGQAKFMRGVTEVFRHIFAHPDQPFLHVHCPSERHRYA